MDQLKVLGVTVSTDFILNEGVAGVLDNLERTGASMIALNPTVTEPAPEGEGSWQPPADAGASPRLFDRTLWGQHGLWLRSAPSYRPNRSLYSACPYKPRNPTDLTDRHGDTVSNFVDAAIKRGFKVFFQLDGTTAAGMRDEDRPLLPDGRMPRERMANTGSLASEPVRAYIRAYVRDLFEHYPNITGIRPDWPEYPCYKIDEAFQDFSPHVKKWAVNRGYDFDGIRREVGAFYAYIHGSLRNDDLESWASAERGRMSQISLLRRYPSTLEWLRLKAELSIDLLSHWREAITEFGGADKELSANAFMPPLTLFTGFDFTAAAAYCQAASPKLYTMHWTVMLQFWGKVLIKKNPGLDETLLIQALSNLFDLADEPVGTKLEDYHYPEPDEPHPVSDGAQQRRIQQTIALAGPGLTITPIVHGYGPYNDFVRRFQLVTESNADGVWINRYGYLGDDKLEVVSDLWHTFRE